MSEEEAGTKYLILEAALEEIARDDLNTGPVFVQCRYCSASSYKKVKQDIKHKMDCPASIAFRALSKVKYG